MRYRCLVASMKFAFADWPSREPRRLIARACTSLLGIINSEADGVSIGVSPHFSAKTRQYADQVAADVAEVAAATIGTYSRKVGAGAAASEKWIAASVLMFGALAGATMVAAAPVQAAEWSSAGGAVSERPDVGIAGEAEGSAVTPAVAPDGTLVWPTPTSPHARPSSAAAAQGWMQSPRPRTARASGRGRWTILCWARSPTVPGSECRGGASDGARVGLVLPRRHLRLGRQGPVGGRAARWPRRRRYTAGSAVPVTSVAGRWGAVSPHARCAGADVEATGSGCFETHEVVVS